MNRLCSLFLLASAAAYSAPVQWTIANGGNDHWYEFVVAPGITWDQARADALAAGGYLVNITSAAENAFVSSLLSGAVETWIGASDVAVEEEFRWADGPEGGQLLVYHSFHPNEPNNFGGSENHVATGYQGGLWNDVGGTGTISGYVVESSVPEPSTFALGLVSLAGLAVWRRRG